MPKITLNLDGNLLVKLREVYADQGITLESLVSGMDEVRRDAVIYSRLKTGEVVEAGPDYDLRFKAALELFKWIQGPLKTKIGALKEGIDDHTGPQNVIDMVREKQDQQITIVKSSLQS